jgi:hypothetical protein
MNWQKVGGHLDRAALGCAPHVSDREEALVLRQSEGSSLGFGRPADLDRLGHRPLLVSEVGKSAY